MEITVTVKSVYGNDVVYPACPKGLVFAKMSGTKTLTPQALKLIRELGYTVTVATPSL